jgi:O-antigen ligase
VVPLGARAGAAPGRLGILLVATLCAGSAIVFGVLIADGPTKLLLAGIGALCLALGVINPRLIMWILAVLVACLSEAEFGVRASESVFRLTSYVLDPVRLNLYEILLYCLLVILLARRAMGGRKTGVPLSVTVLCLVVGAVFGLQFARSMVAGNKYVDVVIAWDGKYIMAGVVSLWCFAELLDSPQTRLRLVDLLFVCATGRALYALARFAFGSGDTADAYRTLGLKVALWESADHILFTFLIIIAVAAWATGRVTGRRLMLWSLAALPLALTVVLSYRRTGWFGLAGALILASLLLVSRNQRALAVLAVTLAFVGAIIVTSYRRFRSGSGLLGRILPDVTSTAGPTRQDEWALAWQTVVKNPFVGELTARRAGSTQLFYWDTRIVHNAFLFTWMKLGLGGLVSLILLGGACTAYAIRGVRRRVAEEHISVAALSLVPFIILLAMFELPLVELRTVLVLAFVGALALRAVPDLEILPDTDDELGASASASRTALPQSRQE